MPETTITEAAELRAAASKIRAIAYPTSHTGPWQVGEYEVVTESGPIAGVYTKADAEHIALWTPNVAILVHDWLVGTAAIAEHGFRAVPGMALDLARAINGTVPEPTQADADVLVAEAVAALDEPTFCTDVYVGNEGEFKCDRPAGHGDHHWHLLAEFGWPVVPQPNAEAVQ